MPKNLLEKTKDNVLGNGWLTFCARLMSVIGVPAFGALISFLALHVWNKLDELSRSNTEFVKTVSVVLEQTRSLSARADAADVKNTTQDARVDRILEQLTVIRSKN